MLDSTHEYPLTSSSIIIKITISSFFSPFCTIQNSPLLFQNGCFCCDCHEYDSSLFIFRMIYQPLLWSSVYLQHEKYCDAGLFSSLKLKYWKYIPVALLQWCLASIHNFEQFPYTNFAQKCEASPKLKCKSLLSTCSNCVKI